MASSVATWRQTSSPARGREGYAASSSYRAGAAERWPTPLRYAPYRPGENILCVLGRLRAGSVVAAVGRLGVDQGTPSDLLGTSAMVPASQLRFVGPLEPCPQNAMESRAGVRNASADRWG